MSATGLDQITARLSAHWDECSGRWHDKVSEEFGREHVGPLLEAIAAIEDQQMAYLGSLQAILEEVTALEKSI